MLPPFLNRARERAIPHDFKFCLKEMVAMPVLGNGDELVGPKAPPPTAAGGARDALVTGVEGTVGARPPYPQPSSVVLGGDLNGVEEGAMQCPLRGDGKSEATSCGRTSLLERCQ